VSNQTGSNYSSDWARRTQALFPAGSNGEYDLPADLVRVFDRGEGCRVWDTENREYIDYTMAWGSALVGHAHPQVVQAISRQAQRGINFAAISSPLVTLAERLAEISPVLERMRFVSTGTEATMTCIRIARGATGRSKILKFEGAFHGSHVEGVANFFWSREGGLPAAEHTGTGGASAISDLLVSPYNDLATAEELIATHANELAAVIIDPVQRSVLAQTDFMQGLRKATEKHGVLLIFDEVVSGFRLALGGACEFYGVNPDLIAYGKAIGGGFPIAVLGGRTDIMDEVREDRHTTDKYVWAASTTGGGPVTAAAAHAVLDILSEPNSYDYLYRMGDLLRNGISEVFASWKIPAQVYGVGALAQFQLSNTPVVDMSTEALGDSTLRREIDLELVRQGLFINPMLTKIYVSLAHDEAAINTYLQALDTTLGKLNR
jgi:glutamate-1-semialdehyde 2,1-aminomutase